jgi:2-haloacid dehalogenase
MTLKAIIFDLGNVLIDWNPAYVFEKVIEDADRRKYFFANICTPDWNEEQDAGRPIAQATRELVEKHPEWQNEIEAFYGRWTEMLGGSIQGTVDLFKAMKDTGRYKFYALTNWSAELFPYALNNYEFLHWFDGRVVSGEEKMRKPAREFYQILLDRYNLKPEETLFIDDNLRNIKAAEDMGIPSIPFESPEQLRAELLNRGIL